MTSGIIQNLARASRVVAYEPDPSAPFGMLVGFIYDIALQNDIDGLWIAVDRGVDNYVPTYADGSSSLADLDVPIARNNDGQVTDLSIEDTEFTDDVYVLLAREIALLSDVQARTIALEAVAIELIREDDEAVAELLVKVGRFRRDNLDISELGILLAREQRALPTYSSVPATPLN